jgi:hypothetical protein
MSVIRMRTEPNAPRRRAVMAQPESAPSR